MLEVREINAALTFSNLVKSGWEISSCFPFTSGAFCLTATDKNKII